MHISIDKKGFTLVETLVAISILVIVILGPMTIAQKGVQNAYFANDQITAVFLAQEAIEAVRQLRDEEALDAYNNPSSANTSNGFLTNCTGGCIFDNTQSTIQFVPLCTGCAQLYIDPNTGVYSHTSSGYSSPFSRVVTIGHIVGGGAPVDVTVSWNNHGTTKEVKLQTWIYDHYERYEN